MATYPQPVIGDWYINADGQFIRAWGCVYEWDRLSGVILQPLSGNRYCIPLARWRTLDLVRYAASHEPRSGMQLP